MRDKIRIYYRIFIGIIGILIIILCLIHNPFRIPIFEFLIYLSIAVFCANFSVSYGDVIISFEILINFFIFLIYGYPFASLFSFLTIDLAWIIKYFKRIMKNDADSKRILRTANFNSGMYATFYALAGIIVQNLKTGFLKNILSILLFILINEFILIIDFLLQGKEETKEYFKRWFINSIIVEFLTYTLSIPFSIVYLKNGFLLTLPFFIALSVFSFVGNRMNIYQNNLLKDLEKVKNLNNSLRNISGIIDFETLLKKIAEEFVHLFNMNELFIIIKIENYGEFYYKKNEGIRKTKEEIDLKKFNMIYNSESIDIYAKNENVNNDDKLLFESFAKQAEISIKNAYLHKVSISDSLTGLFTRRFFENRLQEEINRCSRENNIFTVVLLDLDNFKKINDSYGHIEGDRILVEFSKTLKKNVRKSDVVARWGGDEFIILFPKIDEKNVQGIINRIKKYLNKANININGKALNINFSYSIFTYRSGINISGTEIFRIIDRKLIEEKKKIKKN